MTAGRDMSLRVARMGDRRGRQRFAVVAEFGRRQAEVAARAVWAEPHYAESDLSNAPAISGTIAIVHRGGRTSFFDKARRAQAAGAVAVIVVNQDDRPFLAHHEAHEPAEGAGACRKRSMRPSPSKSATTTCRTLARSASASALPGKRE